MKEVDIQVQEVQTVPNKMNPKRPTPRQIIIKMPKFKHKEKIAAREKQLVMYKGAPIRLSADFSTKTLHARKDRQEIDKVIRSKDSTSEITVPSKAIT